MDPRARRFAIREYLSTARAALDRGDRRGALDALNAALDLDPEYLAAQALKERVERASDLTREFPSSGSMHRPTQAEPRPQPGPSAPVQAREPLISAEGWVRFETRARARRVEKRAAAARTLIERRRSEQARETIEEIREIDPAHPDLVSLSIELDAAEHLRSTPPWHWGPAVAAVAVFAALLFGARYVEWPGSQPESPSSASVTAVPQPSSAPSEPSATAVDAISAPDARARVEPNSAMPAGAASTVAVEPPPAAPAPVVLEPRPTPEPSVAPPAAVARIEAPAARPEDTANTATPVATAGATAASTPSPEPAVTLPPIAPAVTPASLPGAVPAGPSPGAPADADSPAARAFGRDTAPAAVRAGGAAAIPTVPEEERVRHTLQLYQHAYETLDALSAQAVWPRVDGVALQRAFDGLASQRLTFDSCQVQVRGTVGSAVCHGTARYVPKVGSREPRVEPRTWTFALRKAGEEWQIDSARAER